MQFPDPLLRGTLIKRYKRFLSDHRLEGGSTVAAHCANPGAMLGTPVPRLGYRRRATLTVNCAIPGR